MKTEEANILELTPDILGNRETIRNNTQRGEEIVKIELGKIIIREGFNVRTDYGDLSELSASILENGQTQAGRVDVLQNGTFVLVDGHRRFKAMQLLKEQGHDPLFRAVVNTSKTSEEQRILQMFTSQDNKPLRPHEVSDLIQKLINMGHNQKTVAKKIGKSNSYVTQMMEYASESQSIKNHVEQGNITVSAVVKLKKAIPNAADRAEKINGAVTASDAVGKKVTVRQVTKEDPKQQLAEKIYNAISFEIEVLSDNPDRAKQIIYNNL